jgi:hypothetical protein
MLRRVAVVRTDVSEKRIASVIMMTRIGELGTTLAVTSKRASVANYCQPSSTLMMETLRFSETSVLTRSTRRNIPEDGMLHSYRRENLKSYVALTGWAMWVRCIVSPVRYELSFYISEDGILHSHRRESHKFYKERTVPCG